MRPEVNVNNELRPHAQTCYTSFDNLFGKTQLKYVADYVIFSITVQMKITTGAILKYRVRQLNSDKYKFIY